MEGLPGTEETKEDSCLAAIASGNQSVSVTELHSSEFLLPRLEAGVEFAGAPQLTRPCEIPADGLCMYHCFNAVRNIQSWLEQPRSTGGVALSCERERQEVHDANVLKAEVISLMHSNGEMQAIEDLQAGKFSGTDVLPYICAIRNLTVKYYSTVEPLAATAQYYGKGSLVLEIEHLYSWGEDDHAAPHYRVQQCWVPTNLEIRSLTRAEEFRCSLDHGSLFSFPRDLKQLEREADAAYMQQLATFLHTVPEPWDLRHLALMLLSFFGADFPWYRAAAQGDEELFLAFCYVGRVLDRKRQPIRNEQVSSETGVTDRAKAFFQEFQEILLPGLDMLHQAIARGPLAGHCTVVCRGLAFSDAVTRCGVMDSLLTEGLVEYGSFTSNMSTAGTFMKGMSNSVLLLQMERCGYHVPQRKYGLLVICLGFAGTHVSPLNTHNSREGEVWLEHSLCTGLYDSRISGKQDSLVDLLMNESVD
jgi:hypothetical protein